MVEKRLVSINPDFFKFPTTNKTRKKAPESGAPKPALKIRDPKPQKEKTSKTIKKNLLNYIRQHQQRNYDAMMKPKHDPVPAPTHAPSAPSAHHIESSGNSDFKDSLDYLMKLTKDNEKKQRQNQTIRNPLYVPAAGPRAHHPHPHTNENVSLSLPIEFIAPPSPNSPPIHINPPRPQLTLPNPQYGCMKGGALPTYRNWKNQTQKNYGGLREPLPTQTETLKERLFKEKVEELKRRSNIHPLASSPQYSGGNHQSLKSKVAQMQYGKKLEESKKANKKRIPKQQRTLRRTYRVGRSKIAPKVSVLVSNKTIRKNIYTQSLLLKQTPIKEVRRYLIKHGFIRVGSIAPNDILRRMYENARLICGEIKNHNPDNLLYNFLHGGLDGEQK